MTEMEHRQLGYSGLKIPVLSLGTGTFGGTSDFFQRWGQTDVKEASRLVNICLEHGINFFDTANVYSLGVSEEILGMALQGRRHEALISTKATFSMGDGPNEKGSSRFHLLRECDASLKRLKTDYIDIYFMHGFDERTPVEETLSTLDNLIKSGKVRYIGCSNFFAWQVMKSLSISEKNHWEKYVVYQGYYSLIGRDAEWELLPMLQNQGLGMMVWSPLGWGRLTGKIRPGQPLPEGRIKAGGAVRGPQVNDEHLFSVLKVLEEVAEETGRSVPQIAINWLLQRPGVSNVIIGARNETQLRENLGAIDWSLSEDQLSKLEEVSIQDPIYPVWVGQR